MEGKERQLADVDILHNENEEKSIYLNHRCETHKSADFAGILLTSSRVFPQVFFFFFDSSTKQSTAARFTSRKWIL